MRLPSARELWALPELALVPALLAAIDGLLASLRSQHGTLEAEWHPADPPALRAARALAEQLLLARAAIVRYARAVRRTVREPRRDHSLPF